MATDCKGRYSGMSDWDELKNLSVDAYEFLKSLKPEQYEDGRFDLKNGMYVNIESYTTQLREDRRFEAHKRYIDVQYMIFGLELITVNPVDNLDCIVPYDQERDISFYKNEAKGIDKMLRDGEFLIIKPGEAHMPCVCVNEQRNVRKAVIKIPV